MPREMELAIIREVIEKELIQTNLQPILSVKKKQMIGMEACSKGLLPGSDKLIQPPDLFRMARENGLSVEVDRLCRKKAMQGFATLFRQNQFLNLFINFDLSVFDEALLLPAQILGMVESLHLQPSQIVIEIIESKIPDRKPLETFIHSHREAGFLIALDDVGAGHSNLDRIPWLKPDIIKIDRSLIENLDKDFYKQEIIRSLMNLARKIGALVVAEGVETGEETVAALELGADLYQGYYFARPQTLADWNVEPLKGRIEGVSKIFQSKVLEHVKSRKWRQATHEFILDNFMAKLAKARDWDLDRLLAKMTENNPMVESVLVLDSTGSQITKTIFSQWHARKRKLIFQPTFKGSDHTSKDYFYMLMGGGFKKYTTESYISPETGNLCVTLSAMYQDQMSQNTFVFCMSVLMD